MEIGDFMDQIKIVIWFHVCAKLFTLCNLAAQKLFYAEFWHATKERNILLLLEFKHIVVEAIPPSRLFELTLINTC